MVSGSVAPTSKVKRLASQPRPSGFGASNLKFRAVSFGRRKVIPPEEFLKSSNGSDVPSSKTQSPVSVKSWHISVHVSRDQGLRFQP